MKKELKEILPGIGLGELKFGLNRDQVKGMLGEPDEIEMYRYGDSEKDGTESWHYDELDLSIAFDEEEDWRLVTIAVSSEFFEYAGNKVINLTKKEVLSMLESLEIEDLEEEDMSETEEVKYELITSEELSINFWFEDDVLSEIQWGPQFLDDDTINWPE